MKEGDLIYAYDGDEAMQILEDNKPDLIILDMIMDMVTGDTFFLYLKGFQQPIETIRKGKEFLERF